MHFVYNIKWAWYKLTVRTFPTKCFVLSPTGEKLTMLCKVHRQETLVHIAFYNNSFKCVQRILLRFVSHDPCNDEVLLNRHTRRIV